jgi:hypothetical protein
VTVVETILVFAGVPLAIVAVLALLIFLPGGRKRSRYKSGQPWEHAPIWYEPHPDGPAGGLGGPAGGHGGGETKAIGSSLYGEFTDDGHRSLSGHGSPGAGAASAPRPASAGPLGGARGTW